MEKKTVLIPINQGFAFRYIIQTDIFKNLQASGHLIILLVPDPEDKFFAKLRNYENVTLAKYDMEGCAEYIKKSPVEAWLKTLRLFTQNGRYDIQTTVDLHNAYLKDMRNREDHKFIKIAVLNTLIGLGRNLEVIRRLILWVEHKFFTPAIHSKVFEKYKPDLLVVSSLGTFDYDQFLMREARRRNIPSVSVILSWDNTTTRGMPGAVPDHVVAWTGIMKKELIDQNDIHPGKIFIGGVAHFDHYYRDETFYSRKELCERLNLDKDKKILFFVTKSPNGYAWNADIAGMILRAINENTISVSCQLLARLHPIYYRRQNGKYLFQNFLAQFYQLDKDHDGFSLNEPIIDSGNMNYSMPEEEKNLLASILKHSDVMINIFSTLNLEASIFDIPIVNVCFEGTSYDGPEKARYDIALDEHQTHNQRVVRTGGVMMARNEEQLIEYINRALEDPETGKEGRKIIREQEVGPFPGNAGEKIAGHIISLLSDKQRP